jgi:hypothetical protein
MLVAAAVVATLTTIRQDDNLIDQHKQYISALQKSNVVPMTNSSKYVLKFQGRLNDIEKIRGKRCLAKIEKEEQPCK